MKNWYKILTKLKNWCQIITDVKNWYFIVTDVSDKTVQNWNRMQNSAYCECVCVCVWGGGGGYFIKMRNTCLISCLDIDLYVLGDNAWIS